MTNEIPVIANKYELRQRVSFGQHGVKEIGVIVAGKQVTHLLKNSFISTGWVYPKNA